MIFRVKQRDSAVKQIHLESLKIEDLVLPRPAWMLAVSISARLPSMKVPDTCFSLKGVVPFLFLMYD